MPDGTLRFRVVDEELALVVLEQTVNDEQDVEAAGAQAGAVADRLAARGRVALLQYMDPDGDLATAGEWQTLARVAP